MFSKSTLIILSLALASVNAESSISTGADQTTAITHCHFHGVTFACVDGYGNEGYVEPTPTGTAPASYTACHSHGDEYFCLDEAGDEVEFVIAEHEEEDHLTTEAGSTTLAAETSGSESEEEATQTVSQISSDSGSNNVAASVFMLILCVLFPYLL